MNHVQYHVSWFVLRTESGKAPDADGKFSNAPYFNFNDDKVKFDTNDVSNANDNYGTASGFSPKYLDVSAKGIHYGYLLSYLTVDRIQPPSIRPISSMIA
jgi:hypothetical protein